MLKSSNLILKIRFQALFLHSSGNVIFWIFFSPLSFSPIGLFLFLFFRALLGVVVLNPVDGPPLPSLKTGIYVEASKRHRRAWRTPTLQVVQYARWRQK